MMAIMSRKNSELLGYNKGWREDQFTASLRENCREQAGEAVANEGRLVEIPERKGRILEESRVDDLGIKLQ
ncbi:hypothetical protein L0337_02185 [candidate division KSB1 bacterium]|nr:hypothetical protein [candidate division KSB1 bacterium]